MKLTGAQIVIECLLEQGVKTIFGYPGGQILNIYDELYKSKDRIRHILTAHEQGASHAADGYARATGEVGVCMATSGPGATNLVTGIATAYMDSIPIIAITCNVGKSLLGKDSFQEIDITGVTMPITKHNYIVMDVENLAQTIREAFIIAKSGRPGPVLIDIPKDVTAAMCEYEKLNKDELSKMGFVKEHLNVKRAITVSNPSESELQKAADMINNSKFPIIYAGGGIKISGAEQQLLEFAEKAEIPVSESLMARDVFPSNHPLCTRMVGMHGTKASNMAVTESDLVIAIGSRFSDRVYGDATKFAKNGRILQIDIDPAEINKNIPTDGCLVGDVKNVLNALIPLVNSAKRPEWISKIEKWKKEYPSIYDKNPSDSINPKFIYECINKIAGDDTFITTEVGQHQMW
ncbi:MAG: acetolactate synthase large subunit, partial [Treponema sp.]|nr:acetolactate synthase large subunit [Treponema sp.]